MNSEHSTTSLGRAVYTSSIVFPSLANIRN